MTDIKWDLVVTAAREDVPRRLPRSLRLIVIQGKPTFVCVHMLTRYGKGSDEQF